MPQKRYNKNEPETALASIISGLERAGREQEQAIRALLCHSRLVEHAPDPSPEELSELASRVGPELLEFLRAVVRRPVFDYNDPRYNKALLEQVVGPAESWADSEWCIQTPLKLQGPLTFLVTIIPDTNGAILSELEGDRRDIVAMNLIVLADQVGLRKIRPCGAPDCGRIYVKTHRREFCSPQCQKRVYARQMRGRQRELRERRRRARQRRERGE